MREDGGDRPESVVIKSGLGGVAFHKFVRWELYSDNLVFSVRNSSVYGFSRSVPFDPPGRARPYNHFLARSFKTYYCCRLV